MKFLGVRGLVIDGVEFEDNILETENESIIEKLLNNRYFGILYTTEEYDKKIEDEAKKNKLATEKRNKVKELKESLEERGKELSLKRKEELTTIAEGYGYSGVGDKKEDIIIYILKQEKNANEQGENDEGISNS